MRTTIGTCLLWVALSGTAASYRDEVLSDQPAGYWRLGDPAGAVLAENSGSLGAAGNGTVNNSLRAQ